MNDSLNSHVAFASIQINGIVRLTQSYFN